MILASAIKYKIEATGKEVVLCGARHGDIFAQLEALGLEPRQGYEEISQGFIDHKNNFLTSQKLMNTQKRVDKSVQKSFMSVKRDIIRLEKI